MGNRSGLSNARQRIDQTRALVERSDLLLASIPLVRVPDGRLGLSFHQAFPPRQSKHVTIPDAHYRTRSGRVPPLESS